MDNTADSMPMVTIVIPYFQRKKGLLLRCVTSIVKQQDYANYHLLVIDDESPVPADNELAELLNTCDKISILCQPNAGPGAARNKGLDNLPDDTKYVAFLDSDDWWEPRYLVSAVTALEAGHDLFFSNSARYGHNETRFEWQKSKGLDLKPNEHTSINPTTCLYAYTGEFFTYALVRSNIISTSALCYRRSTAEDLRFNVDLYNGQDRLFKLALSQKTNAIAFSSEILVQEGEGINIFDSAKWGTTQSLRLNSSYIKLCKSIIRDLNLKPQHIETIKRQLNECRHALITTTLHLLKNGNPVDWGILKTTVSHDPALIAHLPSNLLKSVFKRRANNTSQDQH